MTAEVKKQFDRELEKIVPDGVEAHIDHFLSIDQPDANLIAVVKVKGSLGTATAKRLCCPDFSSRREATAVRERGEAAGAGRHALRPSASPNRSPIICPPG